MAGLNPLTAKQLWGEKAFADATVVMGEKVWHVHRWVLCSQSNYFMKAYEGSFEVSTDESKTKSVDLSDGEFSEQAVHEMLKFLYTHELGYRQKMDALGTVLIADYFQVQILRNKALEDLGESLNRLISAGQFVNYKKWALKILQEHGDTDIEKVLGTVTANNLQAIIYNRLLPSTWKDIINQHPLFANKIILNLVPKPEAAGSVGAKRSAGTAFDDFNSSRPQVGGRRSR